MVEGVEVQVGVYRVDAQRSLGRGRQQDDLLYT